MQISHNYSAQVNTIAWAQARINTTQTELASGTRLSTSDNAWDVSRSNRISTEIQSIEASRDSIQGARSILENSTASLSSMTESLQSMRAPMIQAMSGTNTTENLSQIQTQIESMKASFNQLYETAEYNGVSYLKDDQALTIQTGPNFGDSLDLSMVSFAPDQVGNHTLRSKIDGSLASQTLTFSSTYGETANVNLSSSDDAQAIIDKVNAVSSVTGVSARVEEVSTYSLSLGKASYSSWPTSDMIATTSDPDYSFTGTIEALQSGVSNSSAFANSLKAYAEDFASGAPSELQASVEYGSTSLSSIYASKYSAINSAISDQQIELIGMDGRQVVNTGNFDKTNVDLSALKNSINSGGSGIQANSYATGNSLRNNGSKIEFELTTINGNASISQDFNDTPDPDGYLNNNANWQALHDALEAEGLSVSINSRSWTTNEPDLSSPILDGNGDPVLDGNGDPTYNTMVVNHSEYDSLYLMSQSNSGFVIDSANVEVGESWSYAGTSMSGSGTQYLQIPRMYLSHSPSSSNDVEAYQVNVTGSGGLFSTGTRTYASSLEIHTIGKSISLDAVDNSLNYYEGRSSNHTGTVPDGIAFDSWHDYEVSTTSVGSLFKSADNASHLVGLNDVDMTDPDNWDDAMRAVDKSLERVMYQNGQNAANMSRLGHSESLLERRNVSLAETQSKITDTNYAKAVAKMAKDQILQSSATAMMAHQSNEAKQAVRSFIDGGYIS